MADRNSATPLLALDAVAIDNETTGLDPKVARIVEIGAVKLVAGKLNQSGVFHSLVNPGVKMPDIARGIHGIDDARVQEAPSFAQIWPAFENYLDGHIIIGHSVGYDLAILARETARAGMAFSRPRTLDVSLLAKIAEPSLADYSLDSLASWLGVEVQDRHAALGDAWTAGRIFVALVPKLREVKIRTLAEAEAACSKLTAVLEDHHRAGWIEPVVAPSRRDAGPDEGRLDPYPYRHRVRELMSSPPIYIAGNAPLSHVLEQLMTRKVSSLFVAPPGRRAEDGPFQATETGIVTERDILRAIASGAADALAKPVSAVATRPLVAVTVDSFVYRAIGRMSRLRIRHLGVVDESGFVAGALSARDLLRLRARDAVMLGDEIDEAEDVHELGHAWSTLPAIAGKLLDEGIEARDIAAIISRELGAMTRRAGQIAERRMRDAGMGSPPVPYALLVLGSAGRGESLLAMDQDNAVVFEKGEPDGPEDRWFAAFGTHVADILHEVGVPYCSGGVMAKNPLWRGSLDLWRERLRDWLARSSPADLLAVDIFFDFRAVYGDGRLAVTLWREAYAMAKGQSAFAKLLAETAGDFEPPLGWFGIRTENSRVDLKRGGLFVIVSVARVLAIYYGIDEHSTKSRIEGIRALGLGSERDLKAMIETQRVILSAILGQQLADIAAGRPPSNKVELKRLSRDEQTELKDALSSIRYSHEMLRDLLVARPF